MPPAPARTVLAPQTGDRPAGSTASDQAGQEPFPENGTALGTHLRFNRLSVEDGLSQSTVLSIFHDSQGFVWYGTEDGLNRYDGYAFTIYKHDPEDPDSLSSNWILAILEDSAGTLWIGTKYGGLDAYDRDLDRFSHFQNDPGDPASLSDNEVTAIWEDIEGALWIGTASGGLNRFVPAEGTFTRFQHDPGDPNSLNSNAVSAIHEDRNGTLWVGTADAGLNRFERETGRWWRYQHDPGNPHSLSHDAVMAVAEDQSGMLWIGTGGGGLDKLALLSDGFDPDDPRFVHFQHDPADSRSLSGDIVEAVLQDLDGTLWVGTHGGGLNRLDPETGTFTHYRNTPGDPHSLSNDFVASILQDREGILWIGAEAGGINKLDLGRYNFAHYQNEPDNPNSLGNDMIRGLFQDQAGALWVGTLFGGLDRFDPETRDWRHFRHSPDDPVSLGSDWISAIYQDQAGALWIGTASGLDRYDPGTGTFTHYQPEPDAPPSSPNNDVITIFQESSGEFWIGTMGGLYQFDRERESWSQPYPNNPGDPASLINASIWSIQEDRDAALWIGTLGAGLYRFEPESGILTHFQSDPDDPSSISDNTAGIIFQDQAGMLWISTSGGLNRFDPETEVFTHYREKDGLSNDVIYCVLEDRQGTLWLSTNLGLSRFDPQRETFRNYDVADGLQSNEFNGKACYPGSGGELFFGGIYGINSFFPEQIRDNPYLPPVVITSVSNDDPGAELRLVSEGRKEITLTWPNNAFAFEYVALSFNQPGENQYAYYLEGFDDAWNQVGTRRYGQYTNLPGGAYTLRVIGSNNDGVWNELGDSVEVTVVPPLWGTWWFRSLLGIAALGLVYGGYRLRVASIESRSRDLEKQVEQRTAELQHEIDQRVQIEKALRESEMEKAISEERNRLARDLHDSVTQSIYSLTLLSEAGQRMISGGDFAQAKDNQMRLGEIAQQALQEMRLLVYELRPQILQEEGLIGALEHRLAAVERRAGIKARLHARQDMALPHVIEEELFHLTTEALNNALKHAGASEVTLTLDSGAGALVLAVEDNGRGFDPELVVNQGGIGIPSMIERAEKIGGDLSIQSEPGGGTVVRVAVALDAGQVPSADRTKEQ